MSTHHPLAGFLFFVLAATATAGPPTKAVLLDDLSILEGTIEPFAGLIRVTPAKGASQLFNAQQILFTGDTKLKVYEFVVGKAKQETAEQILEVARWCEKVELLDQAMTHARQAAQMSVGNAEAAALLDRVTKAAAKPKPAAKESKPVASASKPVPANPPASVSTAAGKMFATRVQPILANQCFTCHADKKHEGRFKLTRFDPAFASTDAATGNLAAAVAQLSQAEPMNSPLLRLAVTAHGGQKAPAFPTSDHPAYRALTDWVSTAVPVPVPVKPVDPLVNDALPGTIVSTPRK